MKLSGFFTKLKKLKNNSVPAYIDYLREPINEKLVLLEGGQGANINGNMFAMLLTLQTDPKYSDYTAVFTVTKQTMEKARKRMEFYGLSRVVLAIRNSKTYCKALATAKYLMTDNSFPPYFNKREEQVFFNTWHGTPLKTLGKANKSSLNSLGNVQKNYLMSDYALFPNEFTRQVFMRDYDLEKVFSGKSLIANYPRNYIFYDSHAGEEMKKKLGLEGKSVFAYMPTWRDAANGKERKQQLEITRDILSSFNEKLPADSVLLVNLHFLLASDINCDDYDKVRYFPPEYDTYEVLNACDGLITDYSSVFFDFAVTRKKIILFAYDKYDYLEDRGLYMPFESLPFPIHEDIDGVIAEMEKPTEVPEEFLRDYCPLGWKDSCERLMDMLISGKTGSYELTDHSKRERKLCLLYGGAMPFAHFNSYKIFMEEHPEYDCVLAYRNNLTQNKKELAEDVSPELSVLGLLNAFQFKPKEFLSYGIRRFFGITKSSKTTDELYEREAHRLFYSLKPDIVVDFSNANTMMSGILSKLSGKKYYVLHGKHFYVRPKARKKIELSRKFESEHGFEAINYREKEVARFLATNTDGTCHSSIRLYTKFKNILPLYFKWGNKMVCLSMFSLHTPFPTRLADTTVAVEKKEFTPKYLAFKKRPSTVHRGIYLLSIPLEELLSMPSNNAAFLRYKDRYDLTVNGAIKFCTLPLNMFLGLRGPMCIDKKTRTVAIFRQLQSNNMAVYVRSLNVTDSLWHRAKQTAAWFISLFWHTKKARKLTLLYEKNSSKYEESASVLYEELLEAGYKYSYFIVDKKYEFLDRIPEKYRKNIIYKYSFKHYLYFFRARTFIGTEALAHAIDLKTFNLLALAKIASKNINYVFLQHGVMYMVSLNSESRTMFKRKRLNGKYRVVVSSQAESDHFTSLGRHRPEDIYISGLPKFDRNKHNEDADRIVIMPTWRPWEINEARTEFTETPYFKMIMRIYDAIPEDLREKVIILPHPLIVNELGKLSSTITDKILCNARYDDILADTAVLITDYSSIAYDAFYRGARVIFYWEEKDYCMAQYGPSTRLMLDEENVYGDFAYSTENFGDTVRRNYENPQTEDQIERYSKIVEFRDGRNTERLIGFLKNDEII